MDIKDKKSLLSNIMQIYEKIEILISQIHKIQNDILFGNENLTDFKKPNNLIDLE